MISFDYYCNACGYKTCTRDMDSMKCDCGGDYKLMTDMAVIGGSSNFEPHYSHEVKSYVTSWKDAEEKGKKFRSVDHPNGFVLTQGNKKFMGELKHIHKHKEDYIQESYAKNGLRYKPGSKTKFDEATRTFIPTNR